MQCRGNLCNVGAAVAATGYYQKINWSKKKLPKSDVQTTLHLVFSYAMLSGFSWTTLHKVFTCVMLS